MASSHKVSVSVGKSTYAAIPEPRNNKLPKAITAKLGGFDRDLVPVTVIDWSAAQFTTDDLRKKCQDFAKIDDVWDEAFLSRQC
jgi:hypothetical protein